MTGGKLMVAIPCRSQITASAFESLSWAMLRGAAWWKQTQGPNSTFGLCVIARSHIVDARIEMLKRAVEEKADYLWWLDDDMTPPEDTLERLFTNLHMEQAALSGALCFRRGPPYTPCAFVERDGKQYPVRPEPARIVEVVATGFACLLMDVKRAADVWDFSDGGPFIYKKGLGEDAYYCHLAKTLGHKIVIDTGLIPGHVGEIEYNGKLFAAMSAENPKLSALLEPIGSPTEAELNQP